MPKAKKPALGRKHEYMTAIKLAKIRLERDLA